MKKKTNCAFCKDHKVVKFGGTWICAKCAGKLFKRKNQSNSGVG